MTDEGVSAGYDTTTGFWVGGTARTKAIKAKRAMIEKRMAESGSDDLYMLREDLVRIVVLFV